MHSGIQTEFQPLEPEPGVAAGDVVGGDESHDQVTGLRIGIAAIILALNGGNQVGWQVEFIITWLVLFHDTLHGGDVTIIHAVSRAVRFHVTETHAHSEVGIGIHFFALVHFQDALHINSTQVIDTRIEFSTLRLKAGIAAVEGAEVMVSRIVLQG